MAGSDLTLTGYKFEYRQYFWGDLIYATKAEMQSLGLAVGMSYPGESGGAKRRLNVIDPRGFKTQIELAYNRHQYLARIAFPERGLETLTRSYWKNVAPGVRMYSGWGYCDEYVGTGEALAAAGLVNLDQLPGKPGMRKVRVTIFSNGVAATTNHSRSLEAGAKIIERVSKSTYRVRVRLSEGEAARRCEILNRAEANYEAQMESLPRPKPLQLCIERLLPRPALPVDFSTTVDWATCGWQPRK